MTEGNIDADPPEEEHAESVGLPRRKRSIDMEIARIAGLHVKATRTDRG